MVLKQTSACLIIKLEIENVFGSSLTVVGRGLLQKLASL